LGKEPTGKKRRRENARVRDEDSSLRNEQQDVKDVVSSLSQVRFNVLLDHDLYRHRGTVNLFKFVVNHMISPVCGNMFYFRFDSDGIAHLKYG